MRHPKTKLLPYLVFIVFLIATASLQAQGLINYIRTNPVLSPEQQHYLDQAMKSKFATEFTYATVDFNQFKRNSLTLNLPGGLDLNLIREDRTNVPPGRISWIGRIPNSPGAAHFTINPETKTLVAQIQFDDISYVISPLSGDLHAVILYDMTVEEGCLTPNSDFFYRGEGKAQKRAAYDNPDLGRKYQENPPEQRTTGECNIRVFVGYTDDVDTNRPDIYSDIVTMINTANTGYNNCSGVTYSIELAAALEYVYAETGNMQTDLDCITNTSDGCLDDFHTQRNLWDADQCVLLTANGSGLAWLSLTFGNQFSVTGQGNFFAHTFHHELGHNALLTHAINQSSQPGTAPYAGWGEPTTGCFRTVLAYSDACGTGPCPRQNIFSDNDVNWWSCGGSNYTPGTSNNRNQDRLNLSRSTINGFNTVGNSVSYSGNYDFFAREAVHFAANNDLSYNSATTNKFEFWSGSDGSFRATNSVTLGEGFHARSGSSFRAYLENCSPLPSPPPEGWVEVGEGEYMEEIEGHRDVESFTSNFDMKVFPNPFSGFATLEYKLPEDTEVEIRIVDAIGRTVELVQYATLTHAGSHQLTLDANNWSIGIYYCILRTESGSFSQKIVIE